MVDILLIMQFIQSTSDNKKVEKFLNYLDEIPLKFDDFCQMNFTDQVSTFENFLTHTLILEKD